MRIDELVTKAFASAAGTGSSHMGPSHLLIAILEDESFVASQVLREVGVFSGRLQQFGEVIGAAGTDESSGVRATPRTHFILGVARGISLAQGSLISDSSHLLTALVYSETLIVESMWERLGVSRSDIIGRLAEAGVDMPHVALGTPQTREPRSFITFPKGDLQNVLRLMVERYPPASDAWWGWNELENDRCVINTNRGDDVAAVVRAAVSDVGTVSVGHTLEY